MPQPAPITQAAAPSNAATTRPGSLRSVFIDPFDQALDSGFVQLLYALPGTPAAPDLRTEWDSGASATDNVTRFTTPGFTGSADPGSRVSLFDGTTLIGTQIASAAGTWTIRSAILAEGTHDISVVVTDLAGNTTAPSPVLSVTIDTTAPAAPGTPDLPGASDSGASSADNITAVALPLLTGVAGANLTIQLFDGATQIGSGPSDADGNWTIQPASALAAGAHTIRARAIDSAGNASGFSGGLTIIVDTTAPATPAAPDLQGEWDSGISATDNITRYASPNIVGSAEAGARITLLDGAAVVGSAVANAAGAWAIRPTTLAAGRHEIAVTATDAAGNTSAVSPSLTVTVDTAAPDAPSAPQVQAGSDSGALPTDRLTNINTPVMFGTAAAGTLVTLYDGATIVGTAQADDAGDWAIQTSVLSDGTHFLAARATDTAGNSGAASKFGAVQIDTAKPAPPAITSVGPYTVGGTAEASTTVTLFEGATRIGSALVNGSGGWTAVVSLPYGVHTVHAVATDRAGNASDPSATRSIQQGSIGPDDLAGSPGADLMGGGTGDDFYRVDNAGDVVSEVEGQGLDIIWATIGYTLTPDTSVEFLRADASAGGLTLIGNASGNAIAGGSGDDVIIGAGGRDSLFGQGGADTFVLRTLSDSTVDAAGRDMIFDFTEVRGDLIDLAQLYGGSGTGVTFIGDTAFSGGREVRAVFDGQATIVSGDINGDSTADFAIGVNGTHTLGRENFIF